MQAYGVPYQEGVQLCQIFPLAQRDHGDDQDIIDQVDVGNTHAHAHGQTSQSDFPAK